MGVVNSAGKHDAKDEEVEQASTYADIHHRILGFPQQYNTVVGERGLKLSGGEKQRVRVGTTHVGITMVACCRFVLPGQC